MAPHRIDDLPDDEPNVTDRSVQDGVENRLSDLRAGEQLGSQMLDGDIQRGVAIPGSILMGGDGIHA